MQYLHYPINTSVGATILLTLDRQANVCLLDAANYQKYRRGEQHHSYDKLIRASQVRMQVPGTGCWHVIVDLGKPAERVHASFQVIE